MRIHRDDERGVTTLTLPQRPFLPWQGRLMALSPVVIGVASALFWWLRPGATPGSLAFASMTAALVWLGLVLPLPGWVRTATLTLSPVELHLTAWGGRLLRPRTVRHALQAVSVEVTADPDFRAERRQVLHLRVAGQRLRIRGLEATPSELATVEAHIAEAAEAARERVGDGPAEVPAALRALRRGGRADLP